MNTLYILLDGAEDHSIPEFDGKKPLDVANMPFFKSVAKFKGATDGRSYTHLFLNEFFAGVPPTAPRAAIEALGLGLDMSAGRTAYRMSPAHLVNGMIEWIYDLDDIHETIEETAKKHFEILKDMDPEIDFFLSGRAVITMKCDDIPTLPSPPIPAPFVEVPGLLGKFVMTIAEELDGVTLYPWGCGRFSENGVPFIKSMTAISNTPTALGVSGSMGHRIMCISDVEERIKTAKTELRKNDVFLHIDEIDEYSHQKNPSKKVRMLETTDRLLSKYFSGNDRIVFFVDHGTSSITGEHLLMTVPFWTTFDASIPNGIVPLKNVIPILSRT